MGIVMIVWVYGKFDLPIEAYIFVGFLYFWFYTPVLLFFSLFYYFYLKKD